MKPAIQVDWVSGVIQPSAPVGRLWNTGFLERIDPDGVVASSRAAFLPVEGSHGTSISLLSADGRSLSMSGNPCKFLQGHNLFGSADALGLFFAAGQAVREVGGQFPGVATWTANGFEGPRYTRLDLTRSYRFDSNEIARTWLREVGQYATARSGKSQAKGNTMYIGGESRYWTFKFYLKADEIRAKGKGHGLSRMFQSAEKSELEDWAQGVVRFELTLRGKELARIPEMISPENVGEIWTRYYDVITFNRNIEAMEQDMADKALPAFLAGVLARWRQGDDLRNAVPTNTFYRWRRQALNLAGVDISVPPPKKRARSGSAESPRLDPVGWDPEPIRTRMFHPDKTLTEAYLQKRLVP